MRKVISDIQVGFIKTAIIIIIAAAVATIVSVFVYPYLAERYVGILEGMTPAASDAIPKEDDDLKCPGTQRKDVKCEVADIIRLGYELASDPRMSQTEQTKFHSVFAARAKDHPDAYYREYQELLHTRGYETGKGTPRRNRGAKDSHGCPIRGNSLLHAEI